jgi:hypothetical protein
MAPLDAPQLTLNLAMHSAMIKRIDLDAEGRYLLTASRDKTAKLWDLGSGALLRTFRVPIGPGPEGKLYAGALSPDGQTVALGGWTGYAWEKKNSIYLLDAASGRLLRRLSGLGNVINDLEYSPDGRYLAAALGEGGIRVYRRADGRLVAEDRDYGERSENLAWDQQGRLASVCKDGYLRLYDANFQRLRQVQPSGGKQPFSLAFSPDGGLLAVGFNDSPRLQVLDGRSLELKYEPDRSGAEEVDQRLMVVAFTPDGRYLAAGGFYRKYQAGKWWRQVRLWEQAGRGAYRDVEAGGTTLLDLKARPDGELVFGGAQPDWGRIDPRAGQRLHYQGAELLEYGAKDRSHFRLGPLGDALGVTPLGQEPLAFDLFNRQLSQAPASFPSYRDEAEGMHFTDWEDTYAPRLNGQALAVLNTYEMSRSVDVAQGQAVLGTEWHIYGLDPKGQQRWRTPVPGMAAAVKIAARVPVAAAALDDGSIRWYRLSDGQELLSLLLHPDGRWLLWTPSGYYDAAPGAEDLIGWHVNQGLDQAPLYYPASQFRDAYHRPDLIDLILQTLDEAEALTQADAARPQRSQPRQLILPLPPEVQIEGPSPGSRVDTPQITLRYHIISPHGEPVTGLRISVDGRPLPSPRSLGPATDALHSLTVTIPAADCVVALQAENRHGMGQPAQLPLYWVGSTEKEPTGVDLRPSLYLLAIGVSEYAHDGVRNLRYAAKDAADFASALRRFEGSLYKKVEVKLITEGAAHKDEVLDGLDWLQHQPTQHDVAVIFFAGHGADDNAGNFYYLPHNADPERMRRTAISKEEVQITVRSTPSKILVFMDACHSGGLAFTDDWARDTRRSHGPDINAVVNELRDAENGAVVFTSSTSRQYSLEHEDWHNGAFTKALVEGLQGQARAQGSNKITVKTLDPTFPTL